MKRLIRRNKNITIKCDKDYYSYIRTLPAYQFAQKFCTEHKDVMERMKNK